jgi:hypothetical protein
MTVETQGKEEEDFGERRAGCWSVAGGKKERG